MRYHKLISSDLMLPGILLPENTNLNDLFKKEERYSVVLQGTLYVKLCCL
jgi:hypothetical protein